MSIELERMTPSRAAYFMERFKREEKLLGPNEQAALTYVINMLEKTAAIQQAEAQQPATPEPVAYVDRDGFIIETGLLLTPGTKLYTHPAPSVQDDVARDAERYRFIRDADVSDDLIPDIALYAMESLDEYIDAAMLAAKEGGAA